MAGGIEKGAADDARPQCVGLPEVEIRKVRSERQIKHLEFVSIGRKRTYRVPSSWDQMQDCDQSDQRAAVHRFVLDSPQDMKDPRRRLIGNRALDRQGIHDHFLAVVRGEHGRFLQVRIQPAARKSLARRRR